MWTSLSPVLTPPRLDAVAVAKSHSVSLSSHVTTGKNDDNKTSFLGLWED